MRSGLEAGCYFSVNPAMLKSDRGRALIMDIPRDRLLTETDGPFVKSHGRPATPTDVQQVVEGLAALWGVEPDEAAGAIIHNFRKVIEAHAL